MTNENDNFLLVDFKNYDIFSPQNNNKQIIIDNELVNIDNDGSFIVISKNIKSLKYLKNTQIILKKDEILLFFHFIDSTKYIEDIRESYNNKVLNQIKTDFHRQKIYFNNILVKNINQYMSYLEYKTSSKNYNNEKILEYIFSLSTQAIIGGVFEMLQIKFNEDNIFLAEIPSHLNYNRTLLINFNFYDNNIKFIVRKNMRIFNINKNDNDNNLSICKIELSGEFDYDLKNIDKNFILKVIFI
jgi:hypothetical protein